MACWIRRLQWAKTSLLDIGAWQIPIDCASRCYTRSITPSHILIPSEVPPLYWAVDLSRQNESCLHIDFSIKQGCSATTSSIWACQATRKRLPLRTKKLSFLLRPCSPLLAIAGMFLFRHRCATTSTEAQRARRGMLSVKVSAKSGSVKGGLQLHWDEGERWICMCLLDNNGTW